MNPMSTTDLIAYFNRVINRISLSDMLNAYTDTIELIDVQRTYLDGAFVTIKFDWMDSESDDCRTSTVEDHTIYQTGDGIWRDCDFALSKSQPILWRAVNWERVTKAIAKAKEQESVKGEAYEQAAIWRDLGRNV